MAFNREFRINEDQVAEFLESATDKVKTTENVDMLSDLNKLFKKNVPLTVRKYVLAYLLKEALKHYHSFGNNHRDHNERNDRREKSNNRNLRERTSNTFSETAAPAAEERPRHPRVEIPEGEGTSIFISIGKNRRVYPRDLVGLLIGVAGIDRESIGDIKVLANYSFVQLYTKDAQTAIDKLNGYEYRGRKLAVSYSRQKTDEEESEISEETVETAAVSVPSANQISEEEMAAEDAAAYAAAEKAAADKEPFGV